ncbi:unnamed protein product [Paramecium octaurelia]|uniref:Uncharacterized protein n=1 Tax=Paramecium octaurelia TaxID=43137 RepID=A0A8S1UBM6_PAROT|nr:unnamed protein product [Paramecium octaurelia]
MVYNINQNFNYFIVAIQQEQQLQDGFEIFYRLWHCCILISYTYNITATCKSKLTENHPRVTISLSFIISCQSYLMHSLLGRQLSAQQPSRHYEYMFVFSKI